MIRTATTAALLLAATAAIAQGPERRFDVKGFDAVELDSSDAIRVMRGARFSVTAAGDPRAVAALDVSVRGGTLRVDRRPGRYNDRGATVTVVMPALRAANLSGSGSIRVDGVASDGFTGRLGGSGSLILDTLAARTATFDLSGSGTISATGRADTVKLALGGSGRIDTRRLATRDITVDLGGSGAVTAAATTTAYVRAGGSGSVRIDGSATCTIRKGGTATVHCG
ncbi:head GIN domain-containing protein [uncultured Sphingomonas sp.]|uniref:head GIN domain-containing protein n=1 Tax=uncultured Sphingomonas sp. TaxID=158754 RepID=UPI0025D0C7B2|nr:head GIN domain-containing protein [uncultured Sphingomonas sp.]